MNVVAGHSVVAPLLIEGLPERIDALGSSWERKVEFHLTAISPAKLNEAGDAEDLWRIVTRVASNRSLGPIRVRDEVRRVGSHPTKPQLRTLIVMAEAFGMRTLYEDLSAALRTRLTPPPPHITLYSSDPFDGIGIDDEQELAERAPRLSAAEQAEVMDAIAFTRILGD